MVHTIKEIVKVEPYKLILRFNTGEVRTVDLAAKLNEWGTNPFSKFADLKKHDIFLAVKLDEELETVQWKNGIDLCPDVLYGMSEEFNSQIVA